MGRLVDAAIIRRRPCLTPFEDILEVDADLPVCLPIFLVILGFRIDLDEHSAIGAAEMGLEAIGDAQP
jgi:hypothetical protein